MKILRSLMLMACVAALIVPALAATQSESQAKPDHHMGMSHMGRDMMSGGCAGMMQSMNGGRAPNSQWHSHGQGDQAMPN